MVGKSIKQFRLAKGLTQDNVAEKLHVTRQAVSSWETDKTRPDVDTLTALAELLEVSVEELIYGPETKKTNKTAQISITLSLSTGSALAMVVSYVAWQSIGWAILHGILGWVYVAYYAIKY